MTDNSVKTAANRVECPAARDPYLRMLILGVVMLGWGLWSGYDAYLAVDKQGQPKLSMKTDEMRFLFNAVMFYVLPPAGVVALVWAGRIRRRRLVADEEGLGYVGGEKIAWNCIRRLVPRGKGLLHVHYEGADGSPRRLKLDSWMLKGFNELVAFIEAKSPDVPVGQG